MDHDHRHDHLCPYCGRSLIRPTEVNPARTSVAESLQQPEYIETRVRDVNFGLALGLLVVIPMDIGVFVRRAFSSFGFATNVLVAAALTILLALWYWRMRVDTAATNAEHYAMYQKRMERWNHIYYCAHCDATFIRD